MRKEISALSNLHFHNFVRRIGSFWFDHQVYRFFISDHYQYESATDVPENEWIIFEADVKEPTCFNWRTDRFYVSGSIFKMYDMGVSLEKTVLAQKKRYSWISKMMKNLLEQKGKTPEQQRYSVQAAYQNYARFCHHNPEAQKILIRYEEG
jgi:hypothetical protein